MILPVLAAALVAAVTHASMEDQTQTGPPVAAGGASAKQSPPPAATPLPSVEAGRVKVTYRPLPWQPRMFAVAEGGGAAAGPAVVAGRTVPSGPYRFDFSIALMDTKVPLTLEGARLAPGSYVFVILPSRDGREMRLQCRKVAPGTRLHRGQLSEVPEGEVVSEGPAVWESGRETSPQMKAALVPVAGGLRLILDYGDRRLSRDLKL